MKKNEIYVGTVTSYGSEGEGIIKADGITVFVPFAIPGEKVRFKVLKVNKNIAFAKIEEVLTPAEERVRAKCPVFQKCGGCQLMHLNYTHQLNVKKDTISNCFKKIAFINVQPNKMVASTPSLHYRNKLQLPIREVQGEVKIGFFALNSHRVVDIDNCIIHGEWCEKIISVTKKFIQDKKISAYNEELHKGLLRHIVVKKIGVEYLIILVVNGASVPHLNYFEELLKVALGGDYSLFINLNTRQDNVILTNDFIKISGKGYVCDSLLQLKYTIGPASFMQVNENVKTRLYQKVCDIVGDTDTVIDAYCGAGVLTALLSRRVKKAIGIEIVSEAIDCAKDTVKENGITNAQFICAPCEDVLPNIIKENPEAVVVLDPPRKGLDKKVALAVKNASPKKIVYVSCAPQTLARDIGIICGTLDYEDNNLKKQVNEVINVSEGESLPNGYKIEYLAGYDMFAQCKGIETLCVLTKE